MSTHTESTVVAQLLSCCSRLQKINEERIIGGYAYLLSITIYHYLSPFSTGYLTKLFFKLILPLCIFFCKFLLCCPCSMYWCKRHLDLTVNENKFPNYENMTLIGHCLMELDFSAFGLKKNRTPVRCHLGCSLLPEACGGWVGTRCGTLSVRHEVFALVALIRPTCGQFGAVFLF